VVSAMFSSLEEFIGVFFDKIIVMQ